ncbi:MAG: hypothetical protein ABIT76_04230 [Chthoniobacterales bacterium]
MKHFLSGLALLTTVVSASAALKLGDSLTPYEVKNTRTGDTYCQVCAYGAKSAKVVAFGKLGDAAFWSDLEQLQALATKYPKLGVFAQVIDSQDAKAIQAEAVKRGVKFPIVVAQEKDWDQKYQVKGVSRTIYYAIKDNEITWTGVGLEAETAAKLAQKVSADAAS